MRSKLNKVVSIHLMASGHSQDPEKDSVNGTDTPSKKKKGPKEEAPPADVVESPVGKKPKGLK